MEIGIRNKIVSDSGQIRTVVHSRLFDPTSQVPPIHVYGSCGLFCKGTRDKGTKGQRGNPNIDIVKDMYITPATKIQHWQIRCESTQALVHKW